MAYKYSPLKVIHFDFNSPEFITFWSKEERHVNLKGNVNYSVFEMPNREKECKILLEWKFRFFNDQEEQIGSFITEIFFLATYQTDGKTYLDIGYMFEDSVSYSRQKLDELLTNNHLAIVDLGQIDVPPSAVEEVLASMREIHHGQ